MVLCTVHSTYFRRMMTTTTKKDVDCTAETTIIRRSGSEAVAFKKNGDEHRINLSFCYRLMRMQRVASEIQYRLAYLSTLGGAYHLCNHPKVALDIAIKQEGVGRFLGSTAVVLKAKVFQAINLALIAYGKDKRSENNLMKTRVNKNLLRRSEKMLQDCYCIASDKLQMDESLKIFVQSSEEWLRKQLIALAAEGSNEVEIVHFHYAGGREIHEGEKVPCSSRVEELQ